jgi:ribosomal protein S12 methylthiotransferase accessory factor
VSDEIELIGEGRLRTAIAERVGGVLPGGLVLAASDHWDSALLDQARTGDRPFLGVHVEPGRVVIGPLVRPGVPGCRTCVERRRQGIDPDHAASRAALSEWTAGSAGLTTFAVAAVASVVAGEVAAVACGDRPLTRNAVVTVDLERLLPAVHPFLPDPHCPRCAVPAGDEARVLRLDPRAKPDRRVLRVGDVDPAALRESYVDEFAGVVPALFSSTACGLPVAYGPTGWPDHVKPEYGVGRALDHRTSEAAAVLEAVERRAGMSPARAPLRARFTDVAACALDPRSLGPPDPGSGYPPFDPDREIGWVWGYSFGRAEPVLVPRSMAYFGHDHSGDPKIAYETSNGCALGGCVEEALLHGLLEVAERDAFLLTWYARLRAPKVAVRSARRPELPLLAERIEREHGYRVLVFDTTADHGVPSVAVLAVDSTPARDRPVVMCSAGAHLDPESACWSALGELALFVSRHVEEYPAHQAEAAAMVVDSDLVRRMDDHAVLYGHQDTLPRWDFLLNGDDETTFADAFSGRVEPAADIRDDVLGLIDRFARVGMDVVAVDQTGPEQRAAGLSAVKAIVPGALPMTFGHRNRRVTGLHRLTRLTTDVNPHPHPFP